MCECAPTLSHDGRWWFALWGVETIPNHIFLYWGRRHVFRHTSSVQKKIRLVAYTVPYKDSTMDLTQQRRLIKAEWESIEVPISDREQDILSLICAGYHDTASKFNRHKSMQLLAKMEHTDAIDTFFYHEFFATRVKEIQQKCMGVKPKKSSSSSSSSNIPTATNAILDPLVRFVVQGSSPLPTTGGKKTMTKMDRMRFDNVKNSMMQNVDKVMESHFLYWAEQMIVSYLATTATTATTANTKSGASASASPPQQQPTSLFYLYTLVRLRHVSVAHLNTHVMAFIDLCIAQFMPVLWNNHSSCLQRLPPHDETADEVERLAAIAATKGNEWAWLSRAAEMMERNPYLAEYGDIALYSHQQRLFDFYRDTVKTKHIYSSLVLYTAPTGTGKTLSPLGLSEEYAVIFVCAARHVGLALARSAIAARKGVAFAFGSESMEEIRLHYLAAKEYTTHAKHGGIGKVNNLLGEKVRIMICDVKSYLVAMEYMLQWNDAHQTITYWDEPTIAMDYPEHELHAVLQRMWQNNRIPHMVLSSATLPSDDRLRSTVLRDWVQYWTQDADQSIEDPVKRREAQVVVENIRSFDCTKTITLLNRLGHVVVPHRLYRDFHDMQRCVATIQHDMTLARYLDLTEISDFFAFCSQHNDCPAPLPTPALVDMDMNFVKAAYLTLLSHLSPTFWRDSVVPTWIDQPRRKYLLPTGGFVQPASKMLAARLQLNSHWHTAPPASPPSLPPPPPPPSALTRQFSVQGGCSVGGGGGGGSGGGNGNGGLAKMLSTNTPVLPEHATFVDKAREKSLQNGGVLLTSADAYTLTDGPTIYLAKDPVQVSTFLLQQSNIPRSIYDKVMEKIQWNNQIQRQMQQIEVALEDRTREDAGKEKKMASMDESEDIKVRQMEEQLQTLRQQLKPITLDPSLIPNTQAHQEIWVSTDAERGMVKNAFVARIGPEVVKQVMELRVDDSLKVLLLMGVGSFQGQEQDTRYLEIMKTLAAQQQLLIVLASSDYIYGTNYQFCHGFIAKDLTGDMTPQKIVQAMGRIGRNGLRQDYTVRFRDDELLHRLFLNRRCGGAEDRNTKEENNECPDVEALNMGRLLSHTHSMV